MNAKLSAEIKNLLYASVGITVFLSILSLVSLINIQPQLPLFYSLAQPQDQLVSKYWLLLFPVISALVSLFHFLFIRYLRFLAQITLKLFACATLIVQLLLTLSLLRIIIITS